MNRSQQSRGGITADNVQNNYKESGPNGPLKIPRCPTQLVRYDRRHSDGQRYSTCDQLTKRFESIIFLNY